MTDENDAEIYRRSLETWGKELQVNMFFEEAAELQLLLSRDLRGRNVSSAAIAEEIADLRIMLDQMAFIHNCEELTTKFRVTKMDRLSKRLGVD